MLWKRSVSNYFSKSFFEVIFRSHFSKSFFETLRTIHLKWVLAIISKNNSLWTVGNKLSEQSLRTIHWVNSWQQLLATTLGITFSNHSQTTEFFASIFRIFRIVSEKFHLNKSFQKHFKNNRIILNGISLENPLESIIENHCWKASLKCFIIKWIFRKYFSNLRNSLWEIPFKAISC